MVGRQSHRQTSPALLSYFAACVLIWASSSTAAPSRVYALTHASRLVGCYKEPSCGNINNQTLQLLAAYDANLTVTKCVQLAAAQKYLYAAIQAGAWCFGGNNISAYTQPVACSQACTGALNQTCGGPCINAIYGTPYTSVFLGCFSEPYQANYTGNEYNRYFQLIIPNNSTMTLQKCIRAAEALQLAYAAVQGAGWCFGGTNYTSVYNTAAANCSQICTGAAQQVCGGAWANAIYTTRFAAPPSRTSNLAASATPPSFTGFPKNGSIYRIRNMVRSSTAGCAAYISVGGPCGSIEPQAVLSVPATNASQLFRFWQVAGSSNLFTMESLARPGCSRYLSSSYSAGQCVAGTDFLTLSTTQSLHTVFKLVPANLSTGPSSTFFIFPTGSVLCASTRLSVQACGNTTRQRYIDYGLSEASTQTFSLEPLPSTPSVPTSLGCYQEPCQDSTCTRSLPTLVAADNLMTPTRCISIAESMGFRLAGVQDGGQCFAGNSTPPLTPSAACNVPCWGDPSVACGDAWVNGIYSTSLAGITYVGCYQEPVCGPVNQRNMTLLGSYGLSFDSAMTILKCITLAEAGGYLYAAVQYGSFCFGSNDISAYINSGVCRTPCSGAAAQTCGGFCANGIYTTSYANPS